MRRGIGIVTAAALLAAAGCASENGPAAAPNGTSASAIAASATAPSATAPSATAPSRRGRVRIAPDVYAVNRFGNSNETILVRGSFNRTRGVAVLRRVGARFFLVDETGVEHTSDADFPPLAPDGSDLYTPNYVADPQVRPDGIELYVDCKAAIEPLMRQTFLRILREELPALGDVTVVNAA